MLLLVAGIPNIIENLFPNLANFIAHILSTIVILVLLTKLVYKPFRETIKERRKKINELLDDAVSKQAKANKNNKEAFKMLDSAKEESKQIINSAKLSADNLKFEIIENARVEATNIQTHAQKIIDFERNEMHEQIRQEAIDLAFIAVEKLLNENISKDKNEKMIQDFIKTLD
ncbi:F0F1 ATP synthase subunit B [Spiroplasma diminutum]|uniref:ATP synthase subunit b n=1 Tax=Spiroplasma diminutum CUAS-1 TaxID=1276221 RepID=S5LYY4_9MOLU|nr:F0F1 ATP synthase subunit B [Spiroplasma diminutum]AGR41756.1 F0F1 ATP synthase subunit B [Spiroplasma diminutum CUAS-1]